MSFLSLQFVVVPAVIFISLFLNIRKGRGLPKISEPYCGKCCYDLRVNWNSAAHCPECGTDLQEPNAIFFGKPYGKQASKSFRMWLLIGSLGLLLFSVGANVLLVFKSTIKPAALAPKPVGITAPINPATPRQQPSATPTIQNP